MTVHARTVIDEDGFLADPALWTPAIARRFAADEGVELTDAHREVIELARRFYRHYELSPHMRALVRYARDELGGDKGTSIYMMQLFGGSPARLVARLAGLPKPDRCL